MKVTERIDRVLKEREDHGLRNLGTGFRGGVATTTDKYEKALAQQAGKDESVKKLVKEVQSSLERCSELAAKDPEILKAFLKLVKATVNSDVLKIAAHYVENTKKED